MTAPRSPERFVPSPYLMECRRRAGAAHALAGAGVVVAAALARRWRTPWLVPAAGLAVVALDWSWAPVAERAFAMVRGDEPATSGACLQPALGGMARRLGLRTPQVVTVPAALQAATASAVLHPPLVVVDERCVPAPGTEPSAWLLSVLAHEMGHHWLHFESSLKPYLVGGPVMLAVLGAGTRSPHRWAALAGVAGLAWLAGLTASRWAERGADEVARQLGHVATARTDWPEWALVQHETRPWWRRLFGRRPQFLRSHPRPVAAPAG
jgi:hypothetical protein